MYDRAEPENVGRAARIANALAQLAAHGVKQQDVALELNVPPQFISDLRCNRRKLSEPFAQICRGLRNQRRLAPTRRGAKHLDGLGQTVVANRGGLPPASAFRSRHRGPQAVPPLGWKRGRRHRRGGGGGRAGEVPFRAPHCQRRTPRTAGQKRPCPLLSRVSRRRRGDDRACGRQGGARADGWRASLQGPHERGFAGRGRAHRLLHRDCVGAAVMPPPDAINPLTPRPTCSKSFRNTTPFGPAAGVSIAYWS